jgi:hypothetical protein
MKWGIALSYPRERGLKWGIVLLVGKEKPLKPLDKILHGDKKSSNIIASRQLLTDIWELGKHD